ncbi:hypothetical protein [Falsiroseomonas sp. E2-1-a20]|uniref:hypothetical protein n=1 Tax=Falsiroseomonas sp. E2-1-a20 TaxID=3239300 RepID=UPI003F3C7785
MLRLHLLMIGADHDDGNDATADLKDSACPRMDLQPWIRSKESRSESAACLAQPSLDRPPMPPQTVGGFRRLVQ